MIFANTVQQEGTIIYGGGVMMVHCVYVCVGGGVGVGVGGGTRSV